MRQGSAVPALLAGYQVRDEQVSLKGVSGEVLVHRLRPPHNVAA